MSSMSSFTLGLAWLVRRLLAAFSRCRPRVLTLIVLFVVGAPLVLANLSYDYGDPLHNGRVQSPGYCAESYGWPLIWLRSIDSYFWSIAMVGHYYSTGRLAGNVAICLVLLAAPVGACEWLLRRYRPKLHWNLKTMLAAVVPTAAVFAGLAAVRNAADEQDEHIAAILGANGHLWVERWGPEWLDLVGADRFRRRVVGAELDLDRISDEDSLRLLKRLEQLPRLRFLKLQSRHLPPPQGSALAELRQLQILIINLGSLRAGEAQALAPMRQLRLLSIEVDSLPAGEAEALARMRDLRMLQITLADSHDDKSDDDQTVAAIGKMADLEHLRLDAVVTSAGLADLAGLKSLKSLALDLYLPDEEADEGKPPILKNLPPLPQLEALSLTGSFEYHLVKDDVRYVARLPRLKSLFWPGSSTDGGLSELLPLQSLEELAISGCAPGELNFLCSMDSLRRLHLDKYSRGDGSAVKIPLDGGTEIVVPAAERNDWLRELERLRHSKPEIVIDSEWPFVWPDAYLFEWGYDTVVEHPVPWRPKRPRWPWNLPPNPGFAAWAAQVGIPSSF